MELMKGLINILEQEIDWGGGVSIPGTVSDTIDTGSSWSDILNGGDTQTNNGSQDTDSTIGLGGIINSSSSNSKVGDLIFSSDTESVNIAKEEAKKDADDYTEGHISIESATTSPTNKDRVVLVGKTLEKDDHFFPVEKGPTGKYGWINDDPDSGDNKWRDFTEY